MSGCFVLLAALAYRSFLREDDAASAHTARPWRWYALAMIAFVVALLSKTVACSLPVALLLMMLWRGERVTIRRLVPLVPMFLIGALLALQTAWLERTNVGASGPDFQFTLAERALIACKALLFYPAKLIAPIPLMFVYPRWQLDTTNLASFWPVPILLAIAATALVAYARGTRGPALALSFFAATLFPALGFFNVYPMRYSFVADHFQYLACLGIIALVAGGAATLVNSVLVTRGAGALVLASCAVLTWQQCALYRDEQVPLARDRAA
jgi:hypothetical protein